MSVAQMPAGWYSDPAARHEHRYWDGQTWTSHVVDAGIAGEEAPTAIYDTGVYRAVRYAVWRQSVLGLGAAIALIALMAEVFSFMLTVGASMTTDEGYLWVTSWMYRPYSSSFANGVMTQRMTVVSPPIILGFLLLAAFIVPMLVGVNQVDALKRAGNRVARIWSSREDRQRWSSALSTLKAYRCWFYRTHARIVLVISGLLSTAIMGVSLLAILNRTAVSATGEHVTNLTLGMGPWLCLLTGIAGIIGVLVAWPWGGRGEVLVHPDGTMEPIS